jgi:hypothetical protein
MKIFRLSLIVALSFGVLLLPLNFKLFNVKAGTADVTIAVDFNTIDVVSKLSTGVTHTQYSADSWNNQASVTSARQLLTTSSNFQNQHIMGWGANNPEPSPGVYDWASLDNRINLIRQTSGVGVITLCCSPDWMKGGASGTTDWSKIEVAPLPSHEADFAELSKQVALRYPDVKYFQVWNELKGMYNGSLNRWDYERYTRLYNLVYDAIKSVRPDAQVGGPYSSMDSWGSTSAGGWPGPTYSWGTLDKRPLDVISYWLNNKHGADFITMDGYNGNKDFQLTDPYTANQKYAEIFKWIRQQPNGGVTLPVWWAEWGPFATPNQSATTASLDYHNSVMGDGLIKLLQVGYTLPLIWQPQGDSIGYSTPVAVWTDTRIVGGGQPTSFYSTQKVFKDFFPVSTQTYKTTNSAPDLVNVIASKLKTILINKRSIQTTINLNSNFVTLAPYQVLSVDNSFLVSSPSSSPSPSPISTPSASVSPIASASPSPSLSPVVDTTQPNININSPLDGSIVLKNTTINIVAAASDNVAISKLEYSVNGLTLCTLVTTPYSCSWKVPARKGAIYNIVVKAYDSSNNTASASAKVTSQ